MKGEDLINQIEKENRELISQRDWMQNDLDDIKEQIIRNKERIMLIKRK
tara:strand:+ start:4325 stop:4471 length:147 start_codon:yes stop_codon:yes gene_type:complete